MNSVVRFCVASYKLDGFLDKFLEFKDVILAEGSEGAVHLNPEGPLLGCGVPSKATVETV